MKRYLAIDIGGTYVKYGLVTEEAAILESSKEKTPRDLEALLSLIKSISQQFSNYEGIAMSAPGAVADEGVIYGYSALPYIHGPNMKELISERTGVPVFIENDANCAGYAEVWKGSAKGKSDVLVMVIGTGIGGAIIKDGLIHKGAHLHGGEFGYMLLNNDIGQIEGVWSETASTYALVKHVAKQKNLDPDHVSGEEVFQWAQDGDEVSIKAIERFYKLLALGIYNLQYVYDPEVILVGGGISARDDLIDQINKRIDQILEKVEVAKVKPKIDICHFKQNANLLGAVQGYRKRIENV
ncbi:transcriptional regulator [Pelagirhabdus alkalitolerans]|uniref:Transcriptional regulator n=1 Tax=Pelagirhabdus alkalitolerans TaxID=1612202 RepID=A0A1G6JWH9_9BACI|nr:ROK family protein [Pelagirhabdus alkalitolerans]SDC23129.1 transcriptional regulator [Pelagirhabdus alkalitolerans]